MNNLQQLHNHFITVTVLLFLIFFFQGCIGGGMSLSDSEKQLLEDYVFTDWDGNEVAVSDFKGSIVVIDFWESWCGPCLSAFPGFQRALDESGDDLVVIAATTGWNEGYEDVMKFKENNSYDFYFVDGKELSSTLGFNAIPFKVIINRDGEFLSSHTGSGGADREYKFLMDLVAK